ncbi:ACT domain-containing protein [uncultured Paraglaciecola sp.]|uniref:ACT domain-containing protein n=1 Tax=uncultured Paraglaciecola sp. TaxID=1765024 RepID=UPI0030D864AA|tara:strand:+ start:53395 stop:53802 length:408 start_codon:yes stop_codon:yes gene_type:complete
MSGETDLNKLIGSMQPVLSESEYVFAMVEKATPVLLAKLAPLGTFYEKEGLTVIVLKANADVSGLAYQGVFQCITLNVHSSLAAVGLTAAVSTALTQQNISANVVAAYYHDHIFVPIAKAKQALTCLQNLAKEAT